MDTSVDYHFSITGADGPTYGVIDPATKTTELRSVAYSPHDREKRLAAKTALKYPPVNFTGIQARAVARVFATYFQRTSLPVWACAKNKRRLNAAEPADCGRLAPVRAGREREAGCFMRVFLCVVTHLTSYAYSK